VTDSDESDGQKIGVALSGGGVRSSLFSLGVMLYLADTGLSRRVRVVSSVSGGSITNAAIGLAGDFSTVTSADFRVFAGRLAHTLAKQGSFFLPTVRRLIFYVVMAFVVLLLAFRTARWVFPSYVSKGASSPGQVFNLYLAFLVAAIFIALSSRDDLQRRRYRKLLLSVSYGDLPIVKQIRRRRLLHLHQLPDSRVTHILCATELNSGKPMFFSKDWAHSEAYGWGKCNVPVSDAVYASAAFPALFPPLRVRSRSLRLSGGSVLGPKPATYVLTDGGAYNNLATQWHRLATKLVSNVWALDCRFTTPEPIEFNVVVNASAPARALQLSRKPIVRNFLAFTRTITIIYENTVRPRLSLLRESEESEKSAVIDISQSPLEAVERLYESSVESVRERAHRSGEVLKLAPHSYWIDFRGTTSTLKTTLAPVGFVAASGLVRHGYLGAAAVLNARLGTWGPDSAPPVHWFDELARTGKSVDLTPNATAPGKSGEKGMTRLPTRW